MTAKGRLAIAAAMMGVLLVTAAAALWFVGVRFFQSSSGGGQALSLGELRAIAPKPLPHVFMTAESNNHRMGRKDGTGWSVVATDKNNDFMNFGPYTDQILPGKAVATYRIMVDGVTDPNKEILSLDIRDANSGRPLGDLPIFGWEFSKPKEYQDFNLPFVAPQGARLEFRTYYFGSCYVNQESVTIRPYEDAAWVFPAGESPFHRMGHKEGLGWAAGLSDKTSDFLNFGPYTRAVAPGVNVARFRLMIDDVVRDDQKIFNLDIRDADKDTIIEECAITRKQFNQPNVYQDFDVVFYAPQWHRLEFRTYFLGGANVNQQQVSVGPAK